MLPGKWCKTMRRMICYPPCRKPSRPWQSAIHSAVCCLRADWCWRVPSIGSGNLPQPGATLERLVRDTAEPSIHAEAMAFLGQVWKIGASSTWQPRSCSAWVDASREKPAALALRHSRELFARLPEARDRQIRSSSSPVLTVWRRGNSGRKLRPACTPSIHCRSRHTRRESAHETRRGGRPPRALTEARAVLQDGLRRYPQGASGGSVLSARERVSTPESADQ
jgi:hypothetical protein